MAFEINITQNDRTAKISIVNSGDVLINAGFNFQIGASLDGASFDEVSLGGSGTISSSISSLNGNFNVSSNGVVSGSYEAGSTVLSLEFSVENSGSISITSFAGTVDGETAVATIPPPFTLSEPSTEPADPETTLTKADFIEGDFEVGSVLSIDSSKLPDLIGGLFESSSVIQWLRDGQAIFGESGATYAVTEADLGSEITATVKYPNWDFDTTTVIDDTVETVVAASTEVSGTSSIDDILGKAGNDSISGLAGDDRLTGNAGNDLLNGGSGTDTAFYSGNQSSYTLTLSPTSTMVTDRRPDGNGTDTLIDMEFLDFDTEIPALGGNPLNLDMFGGPTELGADKFSELIELYIAYFNRAPDALGLNFWATNYSNGQPLEDIATLFLDQDETRALYPEGTSNDTFLENVYTNVLGRLPDAEGFDFWLNSLDSGALGRDEFIFNFLGGAQGSDVGFLENKVKIGTYFAVTKGMSDGDNAAVVMDLFDGTDASIDDAVAAIDGYHADALDFDTGEFLMPLVGVLDDPFSMA